MKRTILSVLMLCILAPPLSADPIQSEGSVFVPLEPGVHSFNLQVALNTHTGQSLVVWEKYTARSGSILGRLLNTDGKPVGGEILLVKGPSAAHPAITYNPTRNEFLLAYDDDPVLNKSQSSIWVKRLTPDGRPAGKALSISASSNSAELSNTFPKIASDPKTGNYAVIWYQEKDEIYYVTGCILTGATSPLLGKIRTLGEGFPKALDFLPSGKKLLVVFEKVVGGANLDVERDYFLATVDPMLSKILPSDVAQINSQSVKRGTILFHVGADLVILKDQGMVFYADQNAIKRRPISLQGKLSGPSTAAFKSPKDNTQMMDPAAMFVATPKGLRGILIATEDADVIGEAVIWAQVLDQKGMPLGAPVRAEVTPPNVTAIEGQMSLLPNAPTNTKFNFLWFAKIPQFGARGEPTAAGIIKLKLTLTP